MECLWGRTGTTQLPTRLPRVSTAGLQAPRQLRGRLDCQAEGGLAAPPCLAGGLGASFIHSFTH